MVFNGVLHHLVGPPVSCLWSRGTGSGPYASRQQVGLLREASGVGASVLITREPLGQTAAASLARMEAATQAEDVARPSISEQEASVLPEVGRPSRFSGADNHFERMLQGEGTLLWACAALV